VLLIEQELPTLPEHLSSPLGFFLKQNILIPNVAEKNVLILVEEKKII
jgi:hypothetical protein